MAFGAVYVLINKYFLPVVFLLTAFFVSGQSSINGYFYNKINNCYFKFHEKNSYFSKFTDANGLISYPFDQTGDLIKISNTVKGDLELSIVNDKSLMCKNMLFSGTYNKLSETQILLIESDFDSDNKKKISMLSESINKFDENTTNEEKSYIFNKRGKLYYNNEDYENALKDFDSAINLFPNNKDYYQNRGLTYIYKGDNDKALLELNKAADTTNDAADESVYYLKGSLNKLKGNNDSAIADLSKAIDKYPDFAEAYDNRAKTYKNLGNYENAILDYTKIIEIRPDSKEAIAERGKAYEKIGDTKKAVLDFEKSNQEITNNDVIARDFFKNGDFENAVKFYRKAIEKNDKDYSLYYEKGFCELCLNNFNEAKKSLENALIIKNSDTDIYKLLSSGYYFNNDYESSLKYLNKGLEINKNNIELKLLRLHFTYKNSQKDYNLFLRFALNDLKKIKNEYDKTCVEYFCDKRSISDFLYYTNKEKKYNSLLAQSYFYIGLKYKNKGMISNAKTCFTIAKENSTFTDFINYFSSKELKMLSNSEDIK